MHSNRSTSGRRGDGIRVEAQDPFLPSTSTSNILNRGSPASASTLDEKAAYEWLARALHPEGNPLPPGQAPHTHDNAPVYKDCCKRCRRVFTAFTGTKLAGSWYSCAQLVVFLRGLLMGELTAGLARALGASRCHLGRKRTRLQDALAERFSPGHFLTPRPKPTRCSGTLARKAASMRTRRAVGPTIAEEMARSTTTGRPWSEAVGTETSDMQLETDKPALHECVRTMTEPGSLVHIDEWKAYTGLDTELGREQKTATACAKSTPTR
jgi:hypothetical protein